MRLSPQLASLNEGAQSILLSENAVHPSNDTIIVRKQYITSLIPYNNGVVKGIDEFVSVLVSAFMPGGMNWDKNVMLQQMEFLLQWTGMLSVMSVESVRRGNKWSILAL